MNLQFRDREAHVRAVFVRGIMPRSGTNFLADTLGCHPRILRSPGQFWEFVPFRFQPELDRYLQSIEESKHAVGFSAAEFLQLIGDAWFAFLTREHKLQDKLPLWKEPSVDNLPSMFAQFPDAKAVLVVRDGRDLIESALNSGFVLPRREPFNRHHWRRLLPDEDFRTLCRMYVQAAKKLLEFLTGNARSKHPKSICVIKFEDLFQYPRETVIELCKFCRLDDAEFDWTAFGAMSVRGSSFSRDQNGVMNFGRGVKKPVDFSPVGRWSGWTEGRKKFFARVCGDVMRQLGYEA